MNNLNQAILDYSIPNELEIIKKKYQQLKIIEDVQSQQKLYQLLVSINHQLPSLKEETDYFASYELFDR